jgi:hypothetical protein
VGSRFSFLSLSLAFAAIVPGVFAAGSEDACPVTKAPDPPFVPPLADRITGNDGSFILGTPGLWALVIPRWKLHETDAKLPYFSEDFSFGKSEADPRLAVVARRLDSLEPLVWADWANGASPSFGPGGGPHPNDHGFMVTSLQIPTAGCWEISARYAPARDRIQTLTYTVRVYGRVAP